MKKRTRQKRGRFFSLRKSSFALMISIFLSYSTATSADTDNTIRLLKSGTWGLEANPNPFDIHRSNPKKVHPAVVYIPPRTIIFKSEESPEWLPGYIKVQLHYGHSVHIKKRQKSGNILTPIKNLIEPPPSNTILVHRPIFCLQDSGKLIKYGPTCEQGGNPFGKGWTSTFEKSPRLGFLDLTIKLDEKTRNDLAARGWDQTLASNVEIAKADIEKREEVGDITMLDKTHPRVEFEYKNNNNLFIRCGTEEISEEELTRKWNIKAEASAGARLSSWLSFIESRLGISLEKSTEQNRREIRKEINTTEKSYLFYDATMIESNPDKTSYVVIEKIFECESSPRAQPASKISAIKFQIITPGGTDEPSYEFTNPGDYLNMPENIYSHHSRPIFLSINSAEQYGKVLKNIMDNQGVDINLAHFMLTNMNTACPEKKRQLCANIIKDNELQ